MRQTLAEQGGEQRLHIRIACLLQPSRRVLGRHGDCTRVAGKAKGVDPRQQRAAVGGLGLQDVCQHG